MERFQIALDLFHTFMLERAHGELLVGPFDLEDDWGNLLSKCTNQISSLPVAPVGNSSKLPIGARVDSSSSSVSSFLSFHHF